MTSRRNFLTQFSKSAGGIMLPVFFKTAQGQQLLQASKTTKDVTTDEDFWRLIRQAYTLSPFMLDLNNGGVSPQIRAVQEAMTHYNRMCNETPSYTMWRVLDKGREHLRKRLAQVGGCSKEEIAINRNASEALETIIFGLNLKKGDEVVLSEYDYPNMKNAWIQREQREGIILKWIDIELPSEEEEALTKAYTDAFSRRTKAVFITHMTNWSGQLLPVQKIARAAKARDIEVIVDGAQTFAQINFAIPDLECDYFGTSLHKWLGAPFGSGMLYVRKEKIANLYPLFAAPDATQDDIRKFEHLGTRSLPIEQGIIEAINFHEMIGIERKEKRLRYLNNYWIDRVKHLPKVKFNTPLHPDFSCALILLEVLGKNTKEVHTFFFKKNIHLTTSTIKDLNGIRISPNVYTTTQDLDRFIQALKELCKA